MARFGRPIRHLMNRALGEYPIVERSGGKRFIVDYDHPAVAGAMEETHQAGMRAVNIGRDYVVGAAEHVSGLAQQAAPSAPTYDALRVPSERNIALYKRLGRVPLSRLIKENALTPTEQGVLLVRALHNQGVGATVVSGVIHSSIPSPSSKTVLVRLKDGRFVDPRSGEIMDKDLSIMKQTRWDEVYRA